ncbi:TRAP transporter small permease [Microvirga vignae]|uniref:TRAP transporter small permease n=1 Tax=Microvirga vignae TaxID=1225564 RepID=UPI00069B63A4|nr:TRAP transporter small permease subunit [Microvirga vignae]
MNVTAAAEVPPLSSPLAALVAFNNALSRVMVAIATLLTAIFILSTLCEIISRALFNYSFVWSGELATLCFVWSLFLSAAVCFRSNAHLVVDMFSTDGTTGLDRMLRFLCFLAVLAFACIFAWLGWKLVGRGFERTTPILGLPMAMGWAAPFVMGVTTILFSIEEYFAPGRVDTSLLPPGAV